MKTCANDVAVRVVHIVNRMTYGGAEMRTVEALPGLRECRVRVDVVSVSGKPGELDEGVRSAGGEVHLVGIGLLFPFRFLALLLRNKYDVVHCSLRTLAGPLLFMAWMVGVQKRIVHYRSADRGHNVGRFKRFCEAVSRVLVRNYATDIVAVSATALDYQYPGRRDSGPSCRIVYNGVGAVERCVKNGEGFPEGIRGLSGASPIVLHVGNFRWQKNHLFAMRVFSRLLRYLPDAQLVFVGDNSSTPEATSIFSELTALSNGVGIADRVFYAGQRQDVRRFYASADVMLFPSLREGLPGAVLEALSVGCPVVASSIPPVTEIAEHVDGIIASPLGSPYECWAKELADIICKCNGSDRDRIRMSFRESPFTLRRHIDALINLYGAKLEHEAGGRVACSDVKAA